jgi:hypothetical protein
MSRWRRHRGRARPTEVLAGLVERVTFHNTENGFCVLRARARGQRDLITVLGHAAMISAGEFVQTRGTWVNDRAHGVQFRAAFLKATAPTTIEGIEKYLGSGIVLPTPGPPVITSTLETRATRTASFWLSASASFVRCSTQGIACRHRRALRATGRRAHLAHSDAARSAGRARRDGTRPRGEDDPSPARN